METDEDHIHYMTETEPAMSVGKRAYFLDGWLLCVQCLMKCLGRNVKEIHRESGIERQMTADIKGI